MVDDESQATTKQVDSSTGEGAALKFPGAIFEGVEAGVSLLKSMGFNSSEPQEGVGPSYIYLSVRRRRRLRQVMTDTILLLSTFGHWRGQRTRTNFRSEKTRPMRVNGSPPSGMSTGEQKRLMATDARIPRSR